MDIAIFKARWLLIEFVTTYKHFLTEFLLITFTNRMKFPCTYNVLIIFFCLCLQYLFINMYYGKAHEKNKNWMDTSSFNLASDYTIDEQKIPHEFSFVAWEKRFLFLSASVPAKSIPEHISIHCYFLKTNSQYD